MTFRCTNPDYLVSRVLGAKGALSVESPPQMQARIRDELSAVLARVQK